jgi:hypothetical protein
MTFGDVAVSLGYGLILNALVIGAVLRLISAIRIGEEEGSRSFLAHLEHAAAGIIAGTAIVVLVVTVCGVAGVLHQRHLVLGLTALAAGLASVASSRMRRRPASVTSLDPPGPVAIPPIPRETRIAAAILVATWIPLLCERLFLPPVAWDALTYHLRFPVLWLETGSLVTSPAPVGDPSHAYFPLVGEMLLYWGMISTGTDLWSSLSQVPFAIAGACALAALAIRCGAGAGGAVLAACCWLGTPSVLRQTVEGMVDIELAAFFLCALLFSIRWGKRGRNVWIYLAGSALGLAVGTKYIGVLLALATLPVLASSTRGVLRSREGATGGVAWDLMVASTLLVGLGGYTYFRNAVAHGNPFLPIHVEIGGLTILPGVRSPAHYYGEGILNVGWPEFLLSPRSMLEMGPLFTILAALPFVALFAFRGWRAVPEDPARFLSACAALAFLLITFILPYRVHRFVYAVVALSWFLVAVGVRSWTASTFAFRIAIPLLLVQAPIVLFYWAKDGWIAGVTPSHLWGIVLGLVSAALVAGAPARGIRWLSAPRIRFACGAMGVALMLLLGTFWTVRYERFRFERWERYWGTRHEWRNRDEPRPDLRDWSLSWRYVAELTRIEPALVAFSGTNLPYPLGGFAMRNPVRFIPRTEGSRSLWSWGPDLPRVDTPGTREDWERNMMRSGAKYLCVYRLARAPGQSEFPVERVWADLDPVRYRLVWSRPHARVYSIRRRSVDSTS